MLGDFVEISVIFLRDENMDCAPTAKWINAKLCTFSDSYPALEYKLVANDSMISRFKIHAKKMISYPTTEQIQAQMQTHKDTRPQYWNINLHTILCMGNFVDILVILLWDKKMDCASIAGRSKRRF
jgi:hypothetical protein